MKEGFGELYTRLYNENVQELEALREKEKKTVTKAIIILIITIICFVFMPFISIIGIIILISRGVIKISKGPVVNEYKKMFKEKIVTPLISNVFENGKYEPQRGWTMYEYMRAEYRDDIDRYNSEDMITATIKGKDNIDMPIQFAEVHTEKRTKDSEGRTSYHTQFYGLASKLELNKDIGTRIYIRSNGYVSGFNKNRVKMDMSEFEKLFDVEAQDKILAMRILTADVMTEMIDLYNKFKYRFEVHVINKTIYMRISTGEVFEPNIFKNSMEYKTVEKYYLILQAVMNISKHIYDIISETEI